ncbi:hypothetical protein AB3N60_09945 [Leptospira sp. WS39.C2]
MELKEYIRKIVFLPYGEKLIQIFELENQLIQRAICYNEHTKKSYLFCELTQFPYIKSSSDFVSSKKEFIQFEAYL